MTERETTLCIPSVRTRVELLRRKDRTKSEFEATTRDILADATRTILMNAPLSCDEDRLLAAIDQISRSVPLFLDSVILGSMKPLHKRKREAAALNETNEDSDETEEIAEDSDETEKLSDDQGSSSLKFSRGQPMD